MAFALVAHTGTTGTNTATTPNIDTTGADLIVVGFGEFTGGTGVVITDSKSNTWHALTKQTVVSDQNAQFYYATKHDGGFTVGSGHNFVATGGFSFIPLFVAAFSGAVIASDPFDVQAGNAGSGTGTYTTATITPSQANDLIVSLIVTSTYPTSGGYAIGSSFTKTDDANYLGSANYGGAMAYLFQGALAGVSPTWTWTAAGSATVAAPLAAFKGLGGGGTTYNVSIAESGSAADTASNTATLNNTVAESGTLLDAPTPAVTFLVTITEAGNAVDTETGNTNGNFNDSVLESGSAADTVSATVQFNVTLGENVTMADAESAIATYVAQLLESGAALDSFPVTATMNVTVTENGFAIDSPVIPGQVGSTIHSRQFLTDIGRLITR
jgi:hypothetical protein